MSKDLFEANPSLDRYYETADGTAFYTENSAELHAKTLEDQTVVLRMRAPQPPKGELETPNPEGELETPNPEGELEAPKTTKKTKKQ
jgi:hypothetical protein